MYDHDMKSDDSIDSKLELRALPDGFGELWLPSSACRRDNTVESCSTQAWGDFAKGRFTRGVQVGVQSTRAVGGFAAVGRFRRGILVFGSSVLRHVALENTKFLDS